MLRNQAQHTVCGEERRLMMRGGNISLHFGGLKWAGKSRKAVIPHQVDGVYPRYCCKFQEPNYWDGTKEY